MKNFEITEAGQQYALAHDAHYTTKDLGEALRLYRAVIDTSSKAQEAEYSRTQIQNIVNAVVPKEELLNVYINLALKHIKTQSKIDIPATLDAQVSLGPDSWQG